MMPTRLNPAVHSAIAEPINLQINTRALMRVTLGFLPAYVNLQKRLNNNQHELDCNKELEEEARPTTATTTTTTTMKGGEGDYKESALDREVESSYAEDEGLPEIYWTDIGESSNGWSDSDTDLITTDLPCSDTDADESDWSSDGRFEDDPRSDGFGWLDQITRAMAGWNL